MPRDFSVQYEDGGRAKFSLFFQLMAINKVPLKKPKLCEIW